jgi:hypothetical protein
MHTHISETVEIIFPVFYCMTVGRSGRIASDTWTTNWKELGIIHGLPEEISLHFPGLQKTMKPQVRSADDPTLVSNYTYCNTAQLAPVSLAAHEACAIKEVSRSFKIKRQIALSRRVRKS